MRKKQPYVNLKKTTKPFISQKSSDLALSYVIPLLSPFFRRRVLPCCGSIHLTIAPRANHCFPPLPVARSAMAGDFLKRDFDLSIFFCSSDEEK